MTSCSLEGSPELALLSLIPGPPKGYKKGHVAPLSGSHAQWLPNIGGHPLPQHWLLGYTLWMIWWAWRARRQGREIGWHHLMQPGPIGDCKEFQTQCSPFCKILNSHFLWIPQLFTCCFYCFLFSHVSVLIFSYFYFYSFFLFFLSCFFFFSFFLLFLLLTFVIMVADDQLLYIIDWRA